MKSYNGFTAKERMEADKIQKSAIENGTFKYEKKCCICGQSKGHIMLHLENYYEPLNPEFVKPICVECHMKLHARFKKPNAWINHLKRLRKGYISNPYFSVYNYIKYNPFDYQDEVPISTENFIPDKSKWYETLNLYEENLKDTIYDKYKKFKQTSLFPF